jgi:hypothetical protein
MERRRKTIIDVDCDACNGTGKRPSEWDLRTGAVVALKQCDSCLGRGIVRVNAPAVALELVAA